MLLKVTMVLLLSLPSASFSDVNGFNNTSLKFPTWPIDNCTGMVTTSSKTCKNETRTKDSCKICNDKGCFIHVVVLFPQSEEYILNLNKTSDAIREAKQYAESHIIPNVSFEIKEMDDGCKSETGLGQIIDANDWCPHVIFGHTCDYTLAGVGRIAKILGKSGTPLFSPSGFTYDFTSTKKVVMEDEFYHLINIGSAGYASFAEFLHLIADRYGWNKFALMYEKNEMSEMAGELACYLLISTLINEFPSVDYQSGDLQLLNITYEAFLKEKVGVNYGIVLTCANHSNIRNIAIKAAKLGMMDRGEYLFFNFALYNNAQIPEQPWYDEHDSDQNNALAKKGFQSFLTFYPQREVDFESVRKQEFRGSFYLNDLYEGMIIFAETISNMTSNDTSRLDDLKGCDVVQHMMGKRYWGKENNEIILNCNAQRVADYALVAQNEHGLSTVMGTYSTKFRTITSWNPGNFTFPADVPECGFDLSKCPTYDKVNILVISLISVILIGLLIVATIFYRHYKIKKEIYSQAWKVHYEDIAFLSKDRRSSIHSIMPLKEIDEMSLAGDNQLFAQIGHYKSIRVAIKKLPDIKVNLNHKQLKELKAMKDLSNDNLVKFYGACIDSPNNCLLIEYCPRGSLQDILENQQYNLDSAFRMSLIMDIVRGMYYLHSSPIKSHGALKSSNCLVDSRFVLKISGFGLQFLRGNENNLESDKYSYEYWKRFLWTAPELLRMDNPPTAGTQKGDVYSFAIIMEEIIMREGVFFIEGCTIEPEVPHQTAESSYHESLVPSTSCTQANTFSLNSDQSMKLKTSQTNEGVLEENDIVDALRKGVGVNNGVPLRPTISSDNLNEQITFLIEKCWSENPNERPDFGTLKTKLRQMCGKENEMNLLDNLLTRMEQYANNLESLVQDRTKDYLEEKRKCEQVLYQLLPKSVAQQLIMGESVTAEAFDSVTIYFSDIVGFTALSAESTPLEVVDLLNDLYSLFDSKVENYEVYKVETIGDAYMVVSGLPERNGLKHAFEISRLALELLDAVKQFKIRHRPGTPLRLRIGLHSGPVVAGVVGHKMPRYCLFGDTVNTASRMEQNGEPLKIHISGETKKILDKVGRFQIELRGEVQMKGKGKVTTYWLKGEKENNLFVGDDVLSPQHVAVSNRPCTPRPRSLCLDQPPQQGKITELKGGFDDVKFISEASRPLKLLNNGGDRDHQVIEQKNSLKIQRDETELPLLSITQPSFDLSS